MGTNVFALMVGQRAIEKLQKCFWKDKSPTGGWNEQGRGKKKLSERRNFWRRAPFSIIYLLSEIKLLSDADTKNATKLETISNTIKQFRIFLNMSNKFKENQMLKRILQMWVAETLLNITIWDREKFGPTIPWQYLMLPVYQFTAPWKHEIQWMAATTGRGAL